MKRPSHAAGFTLVEMLVTAAIFAGLLAFVVAMMTNVLTRRANYLNAEAQEQKNQRAISEINYYMATARDYTIFADQASSTNAANAAVEGNFIRILTPASQVVAFSFVPGSPFGKISIFPPGGGQFVYSDRVTLPPGYTHWITSSNGLPEFHWQSPVSIMRGPSQAPSEIINFSLASEPRYLR